MKQAVILAAGRGTRLTDAADGMPKCLVKVGERTLIEHQIRVLRRVGIQDICVVIGHRAMDVRSHLGGRCHYIVNERYAETNSLYSLCLAREFVRGSFLLMNSDVLAHPDVYHRVMAMEGTALAYDSMSGDQDEHMKVSFVGHRLHSISKQMPSQMAHGENVGILQFDADTASRLFDEATKQLAESGEMQWAPAAVNRLAKVTPICGIDISDLPWTEIDFPDDLMNAQHSVWPLIHTGRITPAGTNGFMTRAMKASG